MSIKPGELQSAAKITKFASDDIARANRIMSEADPNGARLWDLMSIARMPEAVERWVWLAAKERLVDLLGAKFDPLERDVSEVFGQLYSCFKSDVISHDDAKTGPAKNWLRIGICWLIDQRGLDPWIVVKKLRPVYFEEDGHAVDAAVNAIKRGRWSELKISIATAAYSRNVVKDAKIQQDAERLVSFKLREKNRGLNSEIESLNSQIGAQKNEISELSNKLQDTQTELEAVRHHSGHSLSETKAGQRVLLRERIAPLLSDAIDALEIEPPVPHIAMNRLKKVNLIIEEVED